MTASTEETALPGVTALAFDVFGTCVDWRTTVTDSLYASFSSKADSAAAAAASAITRADCADFAQQWGASYWRFTRDYVPGTTPWKDVDAHHRDSLAELLGEWSLRDAYSDPEIDELSRVWHRLAPWADSVEGLRRLAAGGFRTAALSNGNREILEDLNGMVGGGLAVLISAADFGAYKPHPSVYRGAIEKLGVAPGEVALVAAHMGDLEGARACGMRTVYVERLNEEVGYSEEQLEEARGWVDVWVSLEEGGFVELARRLGC